MIKSLENNENPMHIERYKKLELVPPDKVFDLDNGSVKIIKIAGETFNFYFPGESHTIDNSVVYITSQKILFGGCMIRSLQDRKPGYIGYANMKEWPVSVDHVLQKFPEAELVVPGHGEPGDISLLSHTVEVLNKWNSEHPIGFDD
jgi:metallo-beta-lactamase class B